jgi:hypothetical protein
VARTAPSRSRLGNALSLPAAIVSTYRVRFVSFLAAYFIGLRFTQCSRTLGEVCWPAQLWPFARTPLAYGRGSVALTVGRAFPSRDRQRAGARYRSACLVPATPSRCLCTLATGFWPSSRLDRDYCPWLLVARQLFCLGWRVSSDLDGRSRVDTQAATQAPTRRTREFLDARANALVLRTRAIRTSKRKGYVK